MLAIKVRNMKKINIVIMALVLLCLQSACSENPKHLVLDLTDYDSIAVTIDYPILSSYSRLQPYIRNGDMYVGGI